jgi:hypothetical protein
VRVVPWGLPGHQTSQDSQFSFTILYLEVVAWSRGLANMLPLRAGSESQTELELTTIALPFDFASVEFGTWGRIKGSFPSLVTREIQNQKDEEQAALETDMSKKRGRKHTKRCG